MNILESYWIQKWFSNPCTFVCMCLCSTTSYEMLTNQCWHPKVCGLCCMLNYFENKARPPSCFNKCAQQYTMGYPMLLNYAKLFLKNVLPLKKRIFAKCHRSAVSLFLVGFGIWNLFWHILISNWISVNYNKTSFFLWCGHI